MTHQHNIRGQDIRGRACLDGMTFPLFCPIEILAKGRHLVEDVVKMYLTVLLVPVYQSVVLVVAFCQYYCFRGIFLPNSPSEREIQQNVILIVVEKMLVL